jgi:large subunit ribosomal protein L21
MPVRSSFQPGLEFDQQSSLVMYAVIRTGGKQYKVAKDDVIVVETVPAEAGASVTLGEVLLVADGAATTVGTPTVAGAEVTATVVEHKKGDKILIFKKRRRHNYRRKNGHRQPLTVLKITGISAGK